MTLDAGDQQRNESTMNDDMKTTALVQYFGSNRMLAEAVGAELKGCSWVGVTFAGGMTELRHIDARTLMVNDLHKHVINLARVTADALLAPKLYRQLRRLPFHPVTLKEAQTRCIERDRVTDLYATAKIVNAAPDLAWAIDYFVSSWMARACSAGTDGEFRGGLSTRWSAGGGDSAVRFRSATKSLVGWNRIFRRANFSTLDCFEFIDKVKDSQGVGLYNDPPFPGPGDAYRHKFSIADQRKLAARLAVFYETKVVCRFYDHPLIRELYPPDLWTWRMLSGGKTQTNEAAPEVLLINRSSAPGGI